jgi:hypothetical protein
MNMKKILVSTLSIGLIAPVMLTPAVSVNAAASSLEQEANITEDVTVSFNNQQKEFLEKLSLVYSFFYFDDNNKLHLDLTNNELKDSYAFTESDLEIMDTILSAPSMSTNVNSGETNIRPMLSVSSGKIWFTYNDIIGTLSSAAMIGPAAVYAAIVGMGAISLGPVGASIAAAVGLLGLDDLAGFTYNITQAVVNKQGVYLGVEMNGVFPNIVSGTY